MESAAVSCPPPGYKTAGNRSCPFSPCCHFRPRRNPGDLSSPRGTYPPPTTPFARDSKGAMAYQTVSTLKPKDVAVAMVELAVYKHNTHPLQVFLKAVRP